MYMDFNIPMVDDSLKLAEADPFELMYQTDNKTCTIKYFGPKNVIISSKQDCVYAVNVNVANLILAPSQECKINMAFPDTSKYYKIDGCRTRQVNDEWDFVQIKPYLDQNHIYCWGNTITIGKTDQQCPNQTFVLPSDADFHINKHFYKAGEFRINHQEALDPLFTLRANMFLQPNIHMNELMTDLALESTADDNTKPSISVEMLISIFFMITAIFSITCFFYFYRKQKNKMPGLTNTGVGEAAVEVDIL